VMKWFAGDGEELVKVDRNDDSLPAIAQYEATRSVTTEDDRRPFHCVATLGVLEEVCEVVIEVPRESSSLVTFVGLLRNE